MKDKKALLVNIDLQVRVVIDEHIDPNMDPEFDEMVKKAVDKRLKEEGVSFIGENIQDFNPDEENPYNPEFDD